MTPQLVSPDARVSDAEVVDAEWLDEDTDETCDYDCENDAEIRVFVRNHDQEASFVECESCDTWNLVHAVANGHLPERPYPAPEKSIYKAVGGSNPVWDCYYVPEDGRRDIHEYRMFTVRRSNGEVVESKPVPPLKFETDSYEAIDESELPTEVQAHV